MKLKFWDKKEDIYTPGRENTTGKSKFTADEWIERNQWISIPGSKVIISDGSINGMVTLEFNETKDQYRKMGAKITENMTDDEVLRAIEDFEENPPISNDVGPEERIAAALEAQVMMSESDSIIECTVSTMDLDDNLEENSITKKSPAYNRIKRNYETGLWGRGLVTLAVQKGRITMDEMVAILG